MPRTNSSPPAPNAPRDLGGAPRAGHGLFSSSDALKWKSPVETVTIPFTHNSPAALPRDLASRTSSATPSRKAMRQSPTLGSNMVSFRRGWFSSFVCERRGLAERFDLATSTHCQVSRNAHGRCPRGLGVGEIFHGWVSPRPEFPCLLLAETRPSCFKVNPSRKGSRT